MLCKQDGIFIERPNIEPPGDGCVYAMEINIGEVMNRDWIYPIFNYGYVVLYRIYVENTGTCELTNVVVTDEKSGNVWTVGDFAPGEIFEGYVSYEIQASDIEEGELFLFAYADAIGDGNNIHVQTHTVEVTETPYTYAYVDFYSIDTGDWEWIDGERVTIEVMFESSSNVNLRYVTARLTDHNDTDKERYQIIAPTEWNTLSIEHTITTAEISNGFNVDFYLTGFRPDGTYYTYSGSRRFRR